MSQSPNSWSPASGGGVPPPPRRSGTPAWAWGLIGCGCLGFGVIPIFASILFPVFAVGRDKARDVSCLANMKAQSNALQGYVQDYDGILPPAARWMTLTQPYVGGSGQMVYQCPQIAGRRRRSNGFCYAFNDAQSGKSTKKMANLATVSVVFESNVLSYDAHGTSADQPARHGHYLGRHQQGNGVIYADGHVQRVPAPLPTPP